MSRSIDVAATGGGPLAAARTVAFFLPQFHPIPENDVAWGPGFTDWHNVARARPRFRGHVQPVLPGQLGFYDLRLGETREAQQDLARRYSVDAFCWYHFWFSGRRLLQEPFDRMLASRDETLPFMLCWANEPWTRNWSGHSGHVIVPQRYSADDDVAHARWLTPVFADPRYVRIDRQPVVLVYQPTELPYPERTFDTWRQVASREGTGVPMILGVESFRNRLDDPGRFGLDGVVEQQPNLRLVRPRWRAAPRWVASSLGIVDRFPKLIRYDYGRLTSQAMRGVTSTTSSGRRLFPTVAPGWDNSPRRQRGAVVITGSTAARYEAWLEATLRASKSPLVFVNAWNEWAEGAHLEPDAVNGTSYLEAHRRAVRQACRPDLAGRSGRTCASA